MTKREMIEAMLAGKTLVTAGGAEAFYDEMKSPPFMYRTSDETDYSLEGAWDFDWRIKPEPKKRPMTREEILGFLANTTGIVARVGMDKNAIRLPGDRLFDGLGILRYEWATITLDGVIGEWHAFEKEVTE